MGWQIKLERLRLLCERVVRREKSKREVVHCLKEEALARLEAATPLSRREGEGGGLPLRGGGVEQGVGRNGWRDGGGVAGRMGKAKVRFRWRM